MRINTETLRDEANSRGWRFVADLSGWTLDSHDATASFIQSKGPLSPDCISADGYPRMYVTGKADQVVEMVQLIAGCEEK